MKRILLLLCLMSAPAAAVEAPRVRRFDNGLTWIHRTVTHNRIVAAELFLPGGDAVEPADRAGVTRLLSAVWVKGTPTRNALQIAQQMESLGAAFGIDAQEDFVAIGGQVIVDNWPQTRALFEDIVFHPTLPVEEIEKER
ncbi:MAG TPA: insulinase family protein, partial [Elusimicrobiota bacterium]|nr:insulinase family protein [Elusimicrobiota bacterium]